MKNHALILCLALSGGLVACGGDDESAKVDSGSAGDAGGTSDAGGAGGSTTDAGADGGGMTAEDVAITGVKTYITTNLGTLLKAAQDLQAAAPAPDADGWNDTADKAAVDAMKTAWHTARQAYEHIEGAIAVLFPELDVSTDERYDGFLSDNGPDMNLFDDQGVTGIHAIERILWSDAIPAPVVMFESGLTGYKAAAFPVNMTESSDFKTKLCARLITDITSMSTQFAPLGLDPSAAYRGVIGSVGEQIEKITKAETGEEESRYSNQTLADMGYNVEGGEATQTAFRSWLLASPGGADLDAKITAGFTRIKTAYNNGVALPPVPATWNPTMPSPADLATPFGLLYGVLKKESDETAPDSLVKAMDDAATAMGIKALPQ